ncbi:MAG: radical SAM protein [Deltaproteobacteria bacterium]|jgi:MoaA/NifB/PqqE/SkfB family radical SAM enzyme|nr:radical SAM protein [Deltaproteobacteria bacterium]
MTFSTEINTPVCRPDSGEKFIFPPFLQEITFNKYSADDLRSLIGIKKLYLRGAAFVGQGIASGLKREGIDIEGYLDSSPRLKGKILHGKPVYNPAEILGGENAANDIFIIMTSGYWQDEFVEEFAQYGLKENIHYISVYDLVPIFPSIDISGVCNLRCIGCPRGNMREHPPVGFMKPDTYTLVIDKLLREIPFLGEVQLYTWGEPLLNKHIHEIIAINKERMVLSIISSNLSLPVDMEKFVKSAPDIVRVSCSGWKDNYEITHTGAKWELFYKNLNDLVEMKNKFQKDIEIELYFHRYIHNTEDFEKVKELAENLGVTFRPVLASLYPRENHVKIRLGREISSEAKKQLTLLTPFSIKLLDGSIKKSPDNRCFENRTFSINWNLNVRVCGVYYMPTVADNFLEKPLTELVQLVATSETCAMCEKADANFCGKILTAEVFDIKND